MKLNMVKKAAVQVSASEMELFDEKFSLDVEKNLSLVNSTILIAHSRSKGITYRERPVVKKKKEVKLPNQRRMSQEGMRTLRQNLAAAGRLGSASTPMVKHHDN